ncbi:GAF domain-containing protein [Cupriavidus sp. 30B13]|uniref:GAF domain-containing protein n=1 Tax=Cupriavidus sp. 30B13 TaxID=3384241 RepID=UPI003CEBC5D4
MSAPRAAAALTAADIRDCLEGVIPGVMATCAPDGTPNVAYLSQVQFVDAGHVALSFQFFNKTRENVLANPQCTVLLIHPESGALYRLSLRYLRTETGGPLFENMKAKLAGIASHSGMSDVFVLRGADIYRVEAIEAVSDGIAAPPPRARRHLLPALRASAARLAACTEMGQLFDAAMDCLGGEFGIDHAMLLMRDESAARLYTVASHGYAASGVGSEIAVGQGVIGVAARERTPIRIAHMTSDRSYGRAMRDSVAASGWSDRLDTEIPLPGLPAPGSQLAVPVCAGGTLLGVLFAESERELRFSYDDEDALAALASQLGQAMRALQACADADVAEPAAAAPAPGPAAGAVPVSVRYYEADGSVFLDQDYLIKGVAGAIFWKLVGEHAQDGRSAFSNRELRLDPALGLPDISDNLEARLVLLARRLVERAACVRIEKTGRGRFALRVARPLRLERIG